MNKEAVIYIAGAALFGVLYAFLKPLAEWPVHAAFALVYFGLLRLIGHVVAKRGRSRKL